VRDLSDHRVKREIPVLERSVRRVTGAEMDHRVIRDYRVRVTLHLRTTVLLRSGDLLVQMGRKESRVILDLMDLRDFRVQTVFREFLGQLV